MQIKFKKLSNKAKIPNRAHELDAGFDLTAISKSVTDKYVEFGTGLAIAIPAGHFGLVVANSRVSKYDCILANCAAIIDSGYTGEIKLRYKHTIQPQTGILAHKTKYFDLVKDVEPVPVPFHPKEFNVGDVVGQLIIIPIPEIEFVEVEELDETDRGEGGFGSTENPVEPVVEPVVETPQPSKKKRERKSKKK